jgi:hypothetical protein
MSLPHDSIPPTVVRRGRWSISISCSWLPSPHRGRTRADPNLWRDWLQEMPHSCSCCGCGRQTPSAPQSLARLATRNASQLLLLWLRSPDPGCTRVDRPDSTSAENEHRIVKEQAGSRPSHQSSKPCFRKAPMRRLRRGFLLLIIQRPIQRKEMDELVFAHEQPPLRKSSRGEPSRPSNLVRSSLIHPREQAEPAKPPAANHKRSGDRMGKSHTHVVPRSIAEILRRRIA